MVRTYPIRACDVSLRHDCRHCLWRNLDNTDERRCVQLHFLKPSTFFVYILYSREKWKAYFLIVRMQAIRVEYSKQWRANNNFCQKRDPENTQKSHSSTAPSRLAEQLEDFAIRQFVQVFVTFREQSDFANLPNRSFTGRFCRFETSAETSSHSHRQQIV